jgi:hypothetical protein
VALLKDYEIAETMTGFKGSIGRYWMWYALLLGMTRKIEFRHHPEKFHRAENPG